MDRPVGAGDNHTVWRKLGQQPVPLFARAQRVFSLLLSGDVALCSPGADDHSVFDNAAQVVQDDFGFPVPVHFVCLDIVEVVTAALESTKKLDILRVGPDQQISEPRAQNLSRAVVAVHSRHGVVAFSEVRELVKHFDLIVHRQHHRYRLFEFKTPDAFRADRNEGTVVLVARRPTSQRRRTLNGFRTPVCHKLDELDFLAGPTPGRALVDSHSGHEVTGLV